MFRVACFASCLVFATAVFSIADRPALREELSLNGAWDFTPSGQTKSTIPVPEAWDASEWGGPGFNCTEAVYEREVTIPSGWAGRIIKVEFEAVNYLADVYVNDALAGSHVGGWIPFAVDITDRLGGASTFTLKVAVKGGSFQPIVDGSGKPLWPVGWYGHQQQWGIIADTWLRAYGEVYVDEAFIQTSVRNDELRVDYVVTNTLSHGVAVTVSAVVFDAATGSITQKTVTAQSVTLGAGEAKAVTLTETWTDPDLWTPDTPHLYHLRTSVADEDTGETIDSETRRFGFREIWIEGNQYILNGTRINLFGTSMVDHCQGYDTLNYLTTAPGMVTGLIDKLKRMNVNIIRFHQAPVTRRVVDEFDELGMFMINESAIYARSYMPAAKATYLSNCSTWIKPWIKGHRNHPSIILWSAENEMGRGWLNWMTASEILALGNRIREFDTTRPVIYDGDQDVGDVTFNYHYPEGYSAKYTGSIYKWVTLLRANKPTGIGEFLTHYGGNGPENQWWHGLIVRGLRYLNFNDVRPYTFDWVVADTDAGLTAQEVNLRNGLAPVALFDKGYDDLGLTVIRDRVYPFVNEGSSVNRTLVLYNDAFSDTNVTVKVLVKSGGVTHATGEGVIGLALGSHRDLPISFQAPYNGGSNMEMVLQTWKGGALQFEETRVFRLAETGASGSYSDTVIVNSVMSGAPVARDDSATTPYETATSLYVLVNDSGTGRGIENFTTPATNATTPDAGSVSNGGGYLTYTPADGFSGVAYFHYAVTNAGGTATGTVAVTVLEQEVTGILSGFNRRMQITFTGYDPPDGSGGPEDVPLTNFPVLVVFSNGMASGFSYNDFGSAHTGYDLRFTAADGTSTVPYEVEDNWVHGGTNYVWVQAPVVTGAGRIWAYWGSEDLDDSPASYTTDGSTWTNGYVAVWHLGNDNNDSTTNANDGTVNGNVTSTTGVIGGAKNFDGSTASINVGNDASLNLGGSSMTISAFVKRATTDEEGWVLNGSGISDPWTGYDLRVGKNVYLAGTVNGLQNYYRGHHSYWYSSATPIGTSWRYIAVACSQPGFVFYLDGAADGGLTDGNDGRPSSYTGDKYIGSVQASAGTWFNGAIDELRVSSAARSADWLWAEYNNMTDPGAFNTYGIAEKLRSSGTVFVLR